MIQLNKGYDFLAKRRDSVKKQTKKLKIVPSLVLESILEAIDDGISIQDRDFRVIYQNEAHKRLIKGNKIGEHCFAAYAQLDDVCPGCPVAKSFEDGLPHTLEKASRTDTGNLSIEIKSSALVDASGEIIAGIEVVRNITERREMEKELRETAKQYRMLFESAGDSIFILQASGSEPGRIIAANRAAARAHGYTIQELLSMKISDLDTEESARNVPERIEQIMRGEWIKFEADHARKDGSEFPVEVNAGMMEIEGTPYILAFDRDISDRKQAEKEREDLILVLRQALENIQTLHGLLPICAWCKKVRDDSGYWKQVEDYIEERSHATFTHGICPECLKKADPALYEELSKDRLLTKHIGEENEESQ